MWNYTQKQKPNWPGKKACYPVVGYLQYIFRIEKMSAVFAKLPKPKFKPDRMKARSQLTQALLGNIQQLGAAPPGSAKMEQENVAVKNENLEKLRTIVKNVDAIATFP